MPRLLLEVIVQTLADAREAARGGADRLEVVRAIRGGGLTPDIELVRSIAGEVSLPLRVMVRVNSGYATDARELDTLRRAAHDFHALGVDGIVLGFAHEGVPSLDAVARVVEASPALRVTFHRAFDSLRDPLSAIDRIAEHPQIDRVLTSGGDGPPAVRAERLHAYGLRAGGRPVIIAGGGVDEQSLTFFASTGCVTEAHVGRAARQAEDPESPVSSSRVRRLRVLAG